MQKTLTSQRGALAAAGVLYPKMTYIRHKHGALFPEVVGVDRTPSATRFRMGEDAETIARNAKSEWASVSAQVADATPHTVVLSCESFWRTLDEGAAERFRALLREALGGTEIRALGYARSPANRYLSQVQQQLKWSSAIRPFKPYDYVSAIDSYRDVTGHPIEVRVFDRSCLLGGDVVRDFFDRAGIADLVPEQKIETHNVSFSAEAMSVLNRMGPKDRPANRSQKRNRKQFLKVLGHLDAQIPGATKPKLRAELAARVNGANPDLSILRDRHGIVFPDVDYDASDPHAVAPSPETVEELCPFDTARRDEIEGIMGERMTGPWPRRLLTAIRLRV